MKGEFTLKALRMIEGAAGNISDNLLAFLTAGYGASVWKLEKETARHRRNRLEAEERIEAQRQLRNLVYRLKQEGLIKQEKKRKGFSWFLTGAGKKKKENLEERLVKGAMPSVSKYKAEKEPGGELKIVIFDIPELKRHKREWLRAVLLALGFNKLQQSVWAGRTKIPEMLINDLDKIDLRPCVHIFSVSKTGTIGEL